MKQGGRIAQSWERNAAAWTEAVRGNKIASRVAGTNESILQAVCDRMPCRVLDVGCGEGWLTHALTERRVEAIGVDGSFELIQRARERPGRFVHLSYGELCSAPDLLDGSFDCIVFNYSLFEEDLTPLFLALRSKLASTGVLIIQTLPSSQDGRKEDACRSGWRTENFRSLGEGFKEAMPYYFRDMESWRSELARAGMQLLEFQEPKHPSSGLPLSLIIVAAENAGQSLLLGR